MEEYMRLALLEAKKAYRKKEVPIGCVIIRNGKVISKGHNMKEKTFDPTNHAEIIAIKKACKKIKNWRLVDCEIYITKKPCDMCMSAIKQARITNIIYGTGSSENDCENRKIEIVSGILENETTELLQKFFKTRRV